MIRSPDILSPPIPNAQVYCPCAFVDVAPGMSMSLWTPDPIMISPVHLCTVVGLECSDSTLLYKGFKFMFQR